jgi:hypothetical protein
LAGADTWQLESVGWMFEKINEATIDTEVKSILAMREDLGFKIKKAEPFLAFQNVQQATSSFGKSLTKLKQELNIAKEPLFINCC